MTTNVKGELEVKHIGTGKVLNTIIDRDDNLQQGASDFKNPDAEMMSLEFMDIDKDGVHVAVSG
jgi:hypothetical protein